MRPLLVCSLEPAAGKTALSVGLARHYRQQGFGVGYLKTAGAGSGSDPDATFVKDLLSLPDSASTLSPVGTHSHGAKYATRLANAFAQVSGHSDLVIIEGGDSLFEGVHLGLSAPEVATILDATAVLVARYRSDLLDGATMAARTLGTRLAGVVINAVPPSQIAKARASLAPELAAGGIRVLGLVPQDRVLLGVTIRDIALRLKARVVCAEEALDELVERLMIGAMSVEGAMVYFRKHGNKAVVTGGDRPEIQLAALATPTRCLILTGGFDVDPRVVAQAKAAGVPVLVTERDTLGAVEAVNELFSTSRFHQKAKVGRLESLIADHVDAAAILRLLEPDDD